MTADGTLTKGHLEQIERCDLGPGSFFLNIGGPGSVPSGWQCHNQSIADPSDCQFNPFWDCPANASYTGVVSCDFGPGLCDTWTYWMAGEKYEWWTAKDAAVPVRIAKTRPNPAHPGWHRWHLDFSNFTSGPPPLSDFEPPRGLEKCSSIATATDRPHASLRTASTLAFSSRIEYAGW